MIIENKKKSFLHLITIDTELRIVVQHVDLPFMMKDLVLKDVRRTLGISKGTNIWVWAREALKIQKKKKKLNPPEKPRKRDIKNITELKKRRIKCGECTHQMGFRD